MAHKGRGRKGGCSGCFHKLPCEGEKRQCVFGHSAFCDGGLSPSTENYDRGDKKELYRQQEIDEYWIVDWQKKEVEIYNLDYDENGEPQYYLWNKFTERNKEELKIVHFPNLSITFDQLFAEVDMEY